MAKTTWTLDTVHSDLGFKIKHLMITNVSGSFKTFKGEVVTTGEDFSTAEIDVTIEMNSIFTNNEQRDAHLRNSDFFETDKYPEMNFSSTGVKRVDDENFSLLGNLTMKGITKQVKLNIEFNGVTKDPWGGERAGFVVTGKINRNDFGMNFNSALETGGLVLGEEVKIISEIELVKQAVAVAA